MKKILLVIAVLFPTAALGQANSVVNWQTGTTSTGAPINAPVSSANPLPVTANLVPAGTQDVNLKQVGGITVLTGAGSTGTGSQRTTVAQDITTIAGAAPGTAGTPSASVISVQGVSGGTAIPTSTTPTQRTIVALDISTVTTGGTAVAALSAGHRTAGGFLQNPKAATIDLCINEQGTASGTTSAGATTCIAPGQAYTLTPAAGLVSVITSDSSHPFSGYGLN